MQALQQPLSTGRCSCFCSSSTNGQHRMQKSARWVVHAAVSTKHSSSESSCQIQRSSRRHQLACLLMHSPSPAQLGFQQHNGCQWPACNKRSIAAASQTIKAAAAAVGDPAPADPCLQLSGGPARSVGALLGAMCGNALGAQVEPEKHYRLTRLFPFGYSDMSWSFDISTNPLPPGHVTGDFIAMLAVGQSLATCGRANALDIAAHMAGVYQPGSPARYMPYTGLALEGLAAGTNPFMLAAHAEGFLQVSPSRASQSCSHRPDRQLHGTTDFTAVLRAVPVALAYREADAQVLQQAVDAAVVFTHPTEAGREGAQAVAAALAWLIKADPVSNRPEELLAYLLESTSSEDMISKLVLLQQDLPAVADVGQVTDWAAFWRSQEWNQVVATANRLSKQNLAMQGTQAAALALWLQLVNWQHPRQAIMMAACLGGYAGTMAALVGAMAGGLHGSAWLPTEWWQQLQDDTLLDQLAEQALQEEGEGSLTASSTAGSASDSNQATAADGEAENREQEDGRSQAANEFADLEQAEGVTTAATGGLEAGAAAAPGVAREAKAALSAAAAAAQGQTAEQPQKQQAQQQEQQGADEELEEEPDLLRVGKYAVVIMGHELAALQPLAEQNPQWM